VVVDDGLYTHRWAAAVLDQPDFQPVGVACLSPFWAVQFNPGDARGYWPVARRRLAYYGMAAGLGLMCKAGVAAAGGWRFSLGLGGRPGSVAAAAGARGLEVLRPPRSDIDEPAFRARLDALRPDLLVCAFSQRADRAFLELPRWGCLNVHFSLLPEHRGREPLFHAMLAGRGAGVSVHWMTAQLDAGPVVLQEPLETTRYRSLHRLILAACELAARVVPAAIRAAAGQRPPSIDSAPPGPTAGWPTPREVAQFKARGLRFV
jgi:folate-dependent phosphoribosylglycinamide formyltransferase PurN